MSGDGPPLLKTGHWLTHLEFDWESPVWRHVNSGFSETHRLVRYDGRGNGLSEWDVSDFSLTRQVEDLEAVADAAGLCRFPILGVSQAAAFSIVYAAKHPERVSKLILYAGYEKGWRQRGDEEKIKSVEAMLTLMENQWSGSIAVAELISATYMPDAPPDHWQWFSDIQRRSTTGINAAALLQALGNIDVQPFLSEVKAPTLVLQGRNDGVVPLECGQNLAAGIPNAQFVGLDTRNHILHAGDPAWSQVLKLCREFLAD
nr:alpha/beta hydrolase [Roseibium sp. MMSF_3544]